MLTRMKTVLFLSVMVSFQVAILVVCPGGVGQADMASPHVIHEIQPDGTRIALHIRGNGSLHWQEDLDGFTVVREKGNSGRYLYADRGPDGHLVPTAHEVGKANPRRLRLQRRVLPSAQVRASMQAEGPSAPTSLGVDGSRPYLAPGPQTLKNLVVLVRFSDHTDRLLPSASDIDVLMNAVGGDPDLAPAGSLRDIYLNNSYGALTIDSTVVSWVTVSNTERYYADGQSGRTTRLHQALMEALDMVDDTVDFNDFDQDHDGYIDSITFLHSGYGAEWGGTDADNTDYRDRIWSHRWVLQGFPAGYWRSEEGVRVSDYHISPALWGVSGSGIGHVGVIAHETGHFLGLPDLYDTDFSGTGIGSWGLMANDWGDDGSQQPPPLMSAWSKMQLGWATTSDLYTPGPYTLVDSFHSDLVYQVTDGFPADEYLLVENRRRKNENNEVVDNIPDFGDGLVIYHIDDSAGYDIEGYPGQPGWPENGNHYRVAVLQADGNYDLEKGINRGDSGDAYRAGHVDSIGPATMPGTDSYQAGIVHSTGHTIRAIGAAGTSMEFDFNVPMAPGNLYIANIDGGSVTLAWDANSPVPDGYRIFVRTDGQAYDYDNSAWQGMATTCTIDGLSENTNYYIVARAFRGAGESSDSNEVQFHPVPAPINLRILFSMWFKSLFYR